MALAVAAVWVAAALGVAGQPGQQLTQVSGQSPGRQLEPILLQRGRVMLAEELCVVVEGSCELDGDAYARATDWFSVLDKSFKRAEECESFEEQGCKRGAFFHVSDAIIIVNTTSGLNVRTCTCLPRKEGRTRKRKKRGAC
jgi:hypothetical protein